MFFKVKGALLVPGRKPKRTTVKFRVRRSRLEQFMAEHDDAVYVGYEAAYHPARRHHDGGFLFIGLARTRRMWAEFQCPFHVGRDRRLIQAANDNHATLNTAFLLMAQYQGRAIIPVDLVCRDYFSHLDSTKFVRKVGAGEIVIPLVRMETSQKAAKGVHLQDLADYLDARRAAAVKECRQLAS